MIPVFIPMPPPVIPTAMIDTIKYLGLQSGLQLCLDAGDKSSYSGSGQTWNDVSGGGVNFNRGTSASSDGADPTFAGVAGRQSKSEYFSYDGGDQFTIAGSVPSWATSMYKANAAFTILEWVYVNNVTNGPTQVVGEVTVGSLQPSSASTFTFANDGLSGTNGRQLASSVVAADGTALMLTTSTISFTNNSWNLIGMSMDESSGKLTFTINGVTEAHTGKTYSGAGTATVMTIGGDDEPFYENSGDRVASVMIWNRTLSNTEMLAAFNGTRAKFGL